MATTKKGAGAKAPAKKAEAGARDARPPAPFTLTIVERQALEAAERRFYSWRKGESAVPRRDRDRMSRLREATTSMLGALEPFMSPAAINRDRAELLARMQLNEGGARTLDAYRDALSGLCGLLLLVKASSAGHRGLAANEDEQLWVCFAADAWAAAGGTPSYSDTSRFSKALAEFRRQDLPLATSRERIRGALDAWRNSGGGK